MADRGKGAVYRGVMLCQALSLGLVACTAPGSLPTTNGPGGVTSPGLAGPGSGLLDARVNPLLDNRDNPLIDARANPLNGVAQDASGNALAGASVRAYPAGALAVGSTATLVSNAAAFFRIGRPRRIQAGDLVVKADASGKFEIPLPPGTFNLEIVAPGEDGRKAWVAEVVMGDKAGSLQEPVVLKPTGRLAGKLKHSDAAVVDFTGGEVFVPGSSYLAKVAKDGSFTLSGIPAGKFRLVGWKAGVGEAYLTDPVEVRPAEETQVSDLVLRPNIPVIDKVRATDGEETDNAAPGALLEIAGEKFGRSTGDALDIRIQGQAVPRDSIVLHEDRKLRFPVPDDALNGTVEVKVGNYSAYRRGFKILKSLAWKREVTRIDWRQGQSQPDLLAALDVRDSSGAEVKQDLDTGRLPPYVRFRVDDRPAVRAGQLPDLALGAHVLRVVAGNLPEATVSLLVLASNAVAPPAPSPVPSAAPTAPPVAPSPSPAPDYTPGILTRGDDAPVWEKGGNAFYFGDVDESGRSLFQRTGGTTVHVLNSDGALLRSWGGMGTLSSVSFAQGGLTVLVGNTQGQVRLVDVATGNVIWMQAHDFPVPIVGTGFRTPANEVLSLDRFGSLITRALSNGAMRATYSMFSPDDLRVSRDGTRAYVRNFTGVKVVNLSTRVDKEIDLSRPGALEALPAPGEFLVGLPGEVRRMSDSLPDAIRTWDNLGGDVSALAVSADGKRFLAAVEDEESARTNETTVACFDLATGVFLDSWRHPGKVFKLRFTADGKRFVVMGDQGVIQTWAF